MVGVKLVDDDISPMSNNNNNSLGRSSPNLAAAATTITTTTPSSGLMRGGGGGGGNNSTPSGLGRPVPIVSAAAAFKQPTSTPTRLSFFSTAATTTTLNGGSGTSVKVPGPLQDPHASLFAEKNRKAMLAQGDNQPPGVLGKLSEMVFGW
jgi:hypothetical protein